MESFESLYNRWLNGGRGPDRSVEPVLVRRYRDAWASAEPGVRDLVLLFVLGRSEVGGFDLVIEGLNTTDPTLAGTAISVASVLLEKGFQLGPATRQALVAFRGRFPEWEPSGQVAVDALDRLEGSGVGA